MTRWLRLDVLAFSACLGCLLRTNGHMVFLLPLVGLGLILCLKRPTNLYGFVAIFMLVQLSPFFHSPSSNLHAGSLNLRGRIENPSIDGDKLSLNIRIASKEKIYGTLYFKTLKDKNEKIKMLLPGESCLFTGEVTIPKGKRNPFGFDFQVYLTHQSIFYQMSVHSITQCKKPHLSPIEVIQRLRLKEIEALNSKLPPSIDELLLALVFGTKEAFTTTDLSSYQSLGLSHLLSISGLHVGLLTVFILSVFRRLGLTKEFGYMLFLIIIAPVYLLLTGGSPSVLRAIVMISFVLIADLVGKKLVPLQSLSLSCLTLLFLSPDLVNQLSFQLSFLVSAIILMSWKILKQDLHRLVSFLTLSGLAQIGALPLTLYSFFQVSLLSMGMNLIYVPLITLVIMPMCFIILVFSWLPNGLLAVVLSLIEWFLKGSQQFLVWAAHLPFGFVNLGRPSPIEMGVLCLLIIGVLKFWEQYRAWKWNSAIPLLFIVSLILLHHVIAFLNPNGKVVFLDVGQGDSIFIQLPHHGKTILIDTGGALPMKKASWQIRKQPFEIGRDVVLNELKGMGVEKLDLLVLTHRDVDHVGGAKGLVGSIKIKNIMVSPYFVPSQSEVIWLEKAKALGVRLIVAQSGETWKSGTATFEVLWPWEKTTTTNGTSLVIKGEWGGATWLFTGDLEIPQEKRVMALYPDLKVDILKLGHHGSRTASSSAFLKTIQPKLGIISVGLNNRYGHPHKEVLDRLKQFHIAYIRTDQSGGITICFNKSRILSIKSTISH